MQIDECVALSSEFFSVIRPFSFALQFNRLQRNDYATKVTRDRFGN